jgi:hypothetical protein
VVDEAGPISFTSAMMMTAPSAARSAVEELASECVDRALALSSEPDCVPHEDDLREATKSKDMYMR